MRVKPHIFFLVQKIKFPLSKFYFIFMFEDVNLDVARAGFFKDVSYTGLTHFHKALHIFNM